MNRAARRSQAREARRPFAPSRARGGDVSDLSAFDPDVYTAPGFLVNPFPFYDAIARRGPVSYDAFTGFWIVTDYAGCATVLRSPAASTGVYAPTHTPLPCGELQMAVTDPPFHTRRRRMLGRLLAPRMPAIRPAVAAYVGALVAALPRRADLMADLCRPASAFALHRLLDLPAGTEAEYAELLDRMRAADGVDLEALQRRAYALCDRSPLLAGWPPGDAAAMAEQLASVAFIGHHATPATLALCLAELLGRDRWARTVTAAVGADGGTGGATGADLDRTADELLRRNGATHMAARELREPLTVAGRTIPAGGTAICLLATGSRDPARPPSAHLAFALGAHRCIGEPLGRALLAEVIAALARRWPGTRLAGPPAFGAVKGPGVRNVAHLSAEVRP